MITSVQNNQVKQWRKLHTKKERTKTGLFLVEGYHLIEEALKSAWKVNQVIIREDIELPSWLEEVDVVVVADNVFEHIAVTKTPQGIIAVVQANKQTKITGELILAIDSIQDPGNLGTIIRTADAAGFDGVILGKGTVDLYNDKVIRATQGSIFHIPIVEADLTSVLPELQQSGFSVWAAALENSVIYSKAVIPDKTVLIVGNEGAGIEDDVLNLADTIVKIPIHGKAESLNVSIAAAILMYYLKG